MLGKAGHRGRQGRQGSQGVQGIQGVEGIEGETSRILSELRTNQKEVMKNQTDLMLGQGHMTDQLSAVNDKVVAIDRSINVDNGKKCIQTRLKCTEDNINTITTELTVVKALKNQKKSFKTLVLEWGTLICGALIMLKTLGILK